MHEIFDEWATIMRPYFENPFVQEILTIANTLRKYTFYSIEV